uniref:Uncharacterized protein n=1 Tax=Alexandrium andersonii TaxID=327968 RepID=A0A7S2DLH8_9DINO
MSTVPSLSSLDLPIGNNADDDMPSCKLVPPYCVQGTDGAHAWEPEEDLSVSPNFGEAGSALRASLGARGREVLGWALRAAVAAVHPDGVLGDPALTLYSPSAI